MNTTSVFKRHELKYFLTQSQYEALKREMKQYMKLDIYGRHLIQNIYFDTPDFLLIRRSIEKPCYKEKLRVRSYGQVGAQGDVFVELKKKYHGVVYKRRLKLPRDEALGFLVEGTPLKEDCQIGHELDYFMRMYGNLRPAMALRYEREAFFGLWNPDFRMTFDYHTEMNADDVLEGENYQSIQSPDSVLLEVKTTMGIPPWLLQFFGDHEIYKTSHSKYGTAYRTLLSQRQQNLKLEEKLEEKLEVRLEGEENYVAS